MFSKFKKFLIRNSSLKNFLSLFISKLGSQILLIISLPVLSRIYSPSDFGALAVFISIISILIVISSAKYELAISLPKKDIIANNLFLVCVIILMINTIIVCISLFYLKTVILTYYYDIIFLKKYFWIIPIGFFLASIFNIFNFFLLRYENYNLLSYINFQQTFINVCCSIIAYKIGGVGLIFGYLISYFFIFLVLIYKLNFFSLFKQFKLSLAKYALVRYKKFPFYSIWAGLFKNFGEILPTLFIAKLFGIYNAGIYFMAHTLLTKPMSAITFTIYNIFYRSSINNIEQKKLGLFTENVYLTLVKAVLPIFYILVLSGEYLVIYFLGDQWVESGKLLKIISIWVFFQFTIGSLLTVFFTIEKQNIGLLLQIILFVLRFISIIFAYYYITFEQTIIFFSFASAIGYLISLVVIFKKLEISKLNILTKIINNFFIVTIFMIPLFIQKFYNLENLGFFISLFFSIFLLMFLYYPKLLKQIKNIFSIV